MDYLTTNVRSTIVVRNYGGSFENRHFSCRHKKTSNMGYNLLIYHWLQPTMTHSLSCVIYFRPSLFCINNRTFINYISTSFGSCCDSQGKLSNCKFFEDIADMKQ